MTNNNFSKFVQYIKIIGLNKGITHYKTLSGLLVKNLYIRKFISYNKFEDKYTKIPDDYIKKKLTKKQTEDFCGSKKLLTKNINFFTKNE